MTITGISGNRYLINNPIWIDITTPGTKVVLTINTFVIDGMGTQSFTFYVRNNKVSFELSEIIKGLFPEPNHPVNPIPGGLVPTSTYNVGLGFNDGISSQTIQKVFIRGGEDSMQTNITLPTNFVCKESDKIPVWTGFPSAKYTLTSLNQIVYTNILANGEAERRKVVTCNPVFLRFLNTKGGYSFWLFEEWDLSKKSTVTERIDRRNNPLDLGLNTSHQLKVSSRVEERYTATLSALLQSPEIDIYGLSTVIPGIGSKNNIWSRIYIAGGSMTWNAFESVNEFNFTFDLLLKQKPELKW